MDIDHDDAFINDDDFSRGVVDLDEKTDNMTDTVDDNGFDDSTIKATNAVLVDDDVFKNNLNNSRKLISPSKLLSMILKYQKQNRLKETCEENQIPTKPDQEPIVFQNLVKKELLAYSIPNKKRLAAKFFHSLLKLKMTNKVNISQNNPYGNICILVN